MTRQTLYPQRRFLTFLDFPAHYKEIHSPRAHHSSVARAHTHSRTHTPAQRNPSTVFQRALLQPKYPITPAERVNPNKLIKRDGGHVHYREHCGCVMVVNWVSLPTSIDKINSRASSLCSLTLPVVRLVEGGGDMPPLYHSLCLASFQFSLSWHRKEIVKIIRRRQHDKINGHVLR